MKKLIFILIIFIFILSFGLIYLNQVLLPTKIKSLLIKAIESNTGKKAGLGAVSFNIFKGLVLRDIAIFDNEIKLIQIKEADCSFLILPLVKKKLIIPRIKIKEANIFLRRNPDGSFNLTSILVKKNTSTKNQFDIFIYSVGISNSSLQFQDDTLSPTFVKRLENINLGLWLSLPLAVKYNLSFIIPQDLPMKVASKGEFKIKEKTLLAKTNIKDFSLKEFSSYYQNSGISFPSGLSEVSLNTIFKENILNAHLEAKSQKLEISGSKFNAKADAQVKADLKYSLLDKKLFFSGETDLINLDILGLDKIEEIQQIKGKVKFNNSGISADKLSALIWQTPLEGSLSIQEFTNPRILVDAKGQLDLAYLSKIISNKFNFPLPFDIKGSANLNIKLDRLFKDKDLAGLTLALDITSADILFNKLKSPFEEINGHLELREDNLIWKDLSFKYLDKFYKTKGRLDNFQTPKVKVNLSSENLLLATNFTLLEQVVDILECKGKYFSSEFYLKGKIEAINSSHPQANLGGLIKLELKDLREILAKAKDKLIPLKLSGLVNSEFNLEGDLVNLKTCFIQGKLYSDSISIYGLKSGKVLLDYNQVDGLVDIPFMQMSLYGGSIQANAKMNFNSGNLPYLVNLNMQDVKIEKLKLDTPAKDKNISGTMQGELKLNGFSSDPAKITGAGRIIITDGNLWQLNLFKGLGQVIFIKDFANIAFSEASCGFLIKDKFIITEDLKMRSTLANLDGPAKIGFDGSLDATLDVSVSEDVPLTGTFKDVTTAIMGEAGRFGVIKINGTLKDPKYKFKASVQDIIKGLKDTFLKSQ